MLLNVGYMPTTCALPPICENGVSALRLETVGGGVTDDPVDVDVTVVDVGVTVVEETVTVESDDVVLSDEASVVEAVDAVVAVELVELNVREPSSDQPRGFLRAAASSGALSAPSVPMAWTRLPSEPPHADKARAIPARVRAIGRGERLEIITAGSFTKCPTNAPRAHARMFCKQRARSLQPSRHAW
jgi:hypothetical protein